MVLLIFRPRDRRIISCDDALFLSHLANPAGSDFRESQGAIHSSFVTRPRGRRGINWVSVFLSKALVFSTHKVFAVDSFEPTNGKMTSSHLLEMLNKRVVHGSAA